MSTQTPLVSIVVVGYRCRDMLAACLRNLRRVQWRDQAEVIVVDNASGDGTDEMVRRDFPEVKLKAGMVNVGFAAGCNIGIREARGRFVLLLNPDAFPEPDALRKAIEYMRDNPECAILGASLVDTHGREQPSARDFPTVGSKFRALAGLKTQNGSSASRRQLSLTNPALACDWVVGAFFMIRVSTLQRTGLLDENYFMYFEEIDLCRAVRELDLKVVCHPDIRVVHAGGASSSRSSKTVSSSGKQVIEYRIRSEWFYYRKNHGYLSALLSMSMESLWAAAYLLRAGLRKGGDSAREYEIRLRGRLCLHTLFSDTPSSVSI